MTYNLRRALERAEAKSGETILSIVVGQHYSTLSGDPAPDENVILGREEGLAKLDYEYDNGFGGADCHPFYAWTQSRVFFVYDGSTGLAWLPRNPIACEPWFGGGGT